MREVGERAEDEPAIVGGLPVWSFEHHGWRALFVGRGAPERGGRLPEDLVPEGVASAWLRQEHGNRVREARAGECGAGDALVVDGPGVAAVIATADCVPVLVVGREGAAIHAGWRGIVAGVVPRGVERLGRDVDLRAWIGPAIGPCCYEVGEDVARAVEEACGAPVRLEPLPGGRPHLDLQRAVAAQLAAAGVGTIRVVERCTRCHTRLLSSYRRDGAAAGRNLALLWRRA